MNAVEIEQAISGLAEAPFDPAKSPFAFLLATEREWREAEHRASGGPGSAQDPLGPYGPRPHFISP